MVNHPGRAQARPFPSPTPEEIVEARRAAEMTQAEAAATVYSSVVTWQQWETGKRRMHPGLWALYGIKAKQLIPAMRGKANAL